MLQARQRGRQSAVGTEVAERRGGREGDVGGGKVPGGAGDGDVAF